MATVIKDDMVFKKYNDGFQCKMKTKKGLISVRYLGSGLFTDLDRPYEVWYPTESSPTGYQTADDIWEYIKEGANEGS